MRAVSVALDIPWEKAYALIASNGYLMGDVISSDAVWGAVLREHGFKRAVIENECPDCYTAADFAKDHPYGVYVLGFGGHTATVKDGNLYDSWNSSNETPVYFWYKRKE